MSDAPPIPDAAPELVIPAHALLALGRLGGVLVDRLGGPDKLPDGFPEPPDLLELWQRCVEDTREDATALRYREAEDLRAFRRTARDIAEPSRMPTQGEALTFAVMAQAHYEAYKRVHEGQGGETLLPWTMLPPERKAMMTATIADMVRAGAIEPGPATTGPRKPPHGSMFVVLAGAPGPGISAVLQEVERELREEGASPPTPAPTAGEVFERLREKLAEHPLPEFVELEDANGAGVGERSRIGWFAPGTFEPPCDWGWRLGPFAAPER